MPDPDDGKWVDPNEINFSQRTMSPNDYAESMENGTWDWNRPGTARQVRKRMKSKRDWDENGCRVPWQGLSERPEVEEK